MREKPVIGCSEGVSPVRKKKSGGFSLVMLTLALSVMLGMFGLAFDMGRMFIVKNELQTFVDSSTMAAVNKLDGTKTGLQLSHATSTAGPLGASLPNGWHFDTIQIPNATDTYATSLNGTYDDYSTASSPNANTYRFLKLTATVNMPLYFLQAIQVRYAPWRRCSSPLRTHGIFELGSNPF